MGSSSARSNFSVLWGWRPTIANTSSWAPAASRARSTEAGLVPTVASRVRPAARARSTSSASGGSQWSRWQWVSITAAGRAPGASSARGTRRARRGRIGWLPSSRRRLGRLHTREQLPNLADLRAALDRPEAGAVEREVLAPERTQQPLGRGRHERVQEHGDHAEPLGERVEHLVEPLGLRVVLGELPGLLVLHVAVQQLDALPDLVQAAGELDIVDATVHRLGEAVELRRESLVRLRAGHHAVAVAPDHRKRAAGEVAVLVGELGRVAGLEAFGRDLAVGAEAHLAQDVEAEGVGAVKLGHLERLDHVPQQLRHLLLAEQEEAVDAHALRHLDPCGHQHGGPDHGVELEDVLADQVDGRGPEAVGQVLALARIGEGGVVVEEGVDPDVDDLRVVPRHGHSPLEPGTAEREVAQSALDEGESLVVAVPRDD